MSVYRSLLDETIREREPLEWARIQYYLGTSSYQLGRALLMFGEQEDGTARLEEAVEALRAALGGEHARACTA